MQEVYDRKTLHQLLGVKPKEITFAAANEREAHRQLNTKKPSFASKSRASRSVQAAWEAADTEQLSDDAGKEQGDAEDDAGRYAIGKHPPSRKRKRGGNRPEVYAVFTSDEDDEEPGELREGVEDNSSAGSLEAEDAEYTLATSELPQKDSKQPSTGQVGRNRSYWLSKAVALGQGRDDSE